MRYLLFLVSISAIVLLHSCSLPDASQKAPDNIVAGYQRRDMDDIVTVKDSIIDAKKIGIVVIDMWNFHWCKTSAARVAAMVPRMNQCLEEARKLGMQVFFCPTDVVNNYVGYPQREKAIAAAQVPLPPPLNIECPHPGGGGCMCGADKCITNYGWTGMAGDLIIKESDILSSGPQELYNVCKEKGITELWYMGVHTNNCVLGKPEGMRNMMNYGLKCVLIRDLQDPETSYDPAMGITPDGNNAKVVKHFEKFLAPSINMGEMLKKNGLWNENQPVDPVRITPWGKVERPHQFRDSVIVTLSAPLNEGADIRYTVDGSEPGLESALYEKPFAIVKSTRLRSSAFKNGKVVCIESVGQFERLPATPPQPDVKLTDMETMVMNRNSRRPVYNKSFHGTSLSIHKQTFENGIATLAPSFLTYNLKPEYIRFTAQCGIDDFTGTDNMGRELAKFPSVIFKIFIDGKLAAESPVMRNAQWPWSFDIPIPEGSRIINLVATDAGDGSFYDYANWVNTGFITRR
ncbi:NPCBM/NEW2 domain-containing protein [Agriterribacter sp.]|uniref:NPCBM/NEW2 domain-containing protein n=1 Tax=Agriterribacter sp. TaxID=2821509 RepID=UPI002B92957D|nr:NPCBM/NEW2 domain-containing protein [Agriterribacter sp.]HTN06821.1 NPCBM/NEW2 domain-containing protein [Agriterribacter sp.]